MKLAIVGSRTFNDYEMVKEALKDLVVTEIVSGGAKGRIPLRSNTPLKTVFR